jgi:hypothetical protein
MAMVLDLEVAPGIVEPQPIPANPAGATVSGRACRWFGFSITEATGAGAATVLVYRGAGVGGLLVAQINLDGGQSARDWWGPQGLSMDSGLFAQVSLGAVTGSLWIAQHPSAQRGVT